MSITAAPKIRRWTREEYHNLAEAGFLGEDDPFELIEGEIIQIGPQNTPHAVAVRLARRALQRVFPTDEYMVERQLEVCREPVDESYADTRVYNADETVSLRGYSLSVSDLLP